MAAYQKRKHAQKPDTRTPVVKPQNEDFPNKKQCQRTTIIEPVVRTTSPLPTLPDDLLEKQRDFDRRSAGKRIPGHVAFMETCDSEQEKAQDPLDFVELVNSNPKIGFLYLSPAVDRSSIEYNPYNLR